MTGLTPLIGAIVLVVIGGLFAAIDAAINADLGHAPPVSYVIADSVIEADAVSMQRFRALADVGEQNAVPIIANAAVTLLGGQSLTRIDRLDNKASLFEAPERAPWRKEDNGETS